MKKEYDRTVRDMELEKGYQETALYELVRFLGDAQVELPAEIQRLVIDVECRRQKINALNQLARKIGFDIEMGWDK
jgi:hypothetical protein